MIKYKIYPYIAGLISLTISYLFIPLYTGGDQIYYSSFYSFMAHNYNNLSFFELYRAYGNYTGGSEPIYFAFVYLSSLFLDKEIAIALVNAIFGWSLARAIINYGAHPLYAIIFPFNFYVLVLFLSAERLKFGILFFLLFTLYKGRRKILSLIMSVLSHFQMPLLFIPLWFRGWFAAIKTRVKSIRRWNVRYFLLGGISGVILIYLFHDHIFYKLTNYYRADLSWDIFKPIILAVLSMAYARSSWEAFFVNLPLILASFLLGTERVVIFSVIVFFIYGFRVKKGINAAVLAVVAYFIIKGLFFLDKVAEYGDGFISVT